MFWLPPEALYSQELALGFELNIIATGLNPTAITLDHHGRIWTVEKDGRILIVNEDYSINEDPVIMLDVDDFNERGLLGIALHPDLENQHPIFIYIILYQGISQSVKSISFKRRFSYTQLRRNSYRIPCTQRGHS